MAARLEPLALRFPPSLQLGNMPDQPFTPTVPCSICAERPGTLQMVVQTETGRQSAVMCESPMRAPPAITIPAIISRRGPKRSTTHPAANPKSGPISSLLIALPEVTCARDQPNSRTMKS